MYATVPAIEVTDYTDAAGVGCPDRKQHPCDLAHLVQVGTKEAVGVPVLAFAEQMQIQIPKLGREAVGVMMHVFEVLIIVPDQTILHWQVLLGTPPFEHIGSFDTLHGQLTLGDGDAFRMRQKDPHQRFIALFMATQDFERIVVTGLNDLLQSRVEFGNGFILHDFRLYQDAAVMALVGYGL
jgi:hypothetical protein